jgi:hypothetical protein
MDIKKRPSLVANERLNRSIEKAKTRRLQDDRSRRRAVAIVSKSVYSAGRLEKKRRMENLLADNALYDPPGERVDLPRIATGS